MMGTSLAHLAAVNGIDVIIKTVKDERQNIVFDKVQEALDRSESATKVGLSAPPTGLRLLTPT